MRTLKYNVTIEASPEVIWNILWEKESYEQWTRPFGVSSTYKGVIAEGQRLHFIAGEGGGMYSDVETMHENRYVAIKHVGILNENNEELPPDEAVKKWTGAMETYTLTEHESATLLQVTVDCEDEFVDMMNNAFPPALEEVKRLSILSQNMKGH
jgi:uncharacterized protein YndB with AHSA1/START domain